MGNRNRYDPPPLRPVARAVLWSLLAILSWTLILFLAWWIR